MKKYQGKNLNDLLKQIALEKKCNVEDITYKVIEERKGILGIGSFVAIEAYNNADIKDFIFEYLGTFFTGINHGVKVEIIQEKDAFKVILDAENNALIIGKNGVTLQSLNLLLKHACNATFEKRVNVYVDINKYKEDKYRRVKSMAKRIALEVRKTKIDVSLDPMPADERKEIHKFLSDFKNIKTESTGEGNKRHLVIKYIEN